MEDKIKNKILGIISESFCEVQVYGLIIDSFIVGEKEFNYKKVYDEFQARVLLNDNIHNTKKYSKFFDNIIQSVFNKEIMPLIMKEWDKIYGFVESHQEQYQPFLFIRGYEGYRDLMEEIMMETLDDVIFPSSWGYIEEDELDVTE
jgi:hypothetical protein